MPIRSILSFLMSVFLLIACSEAPVVQERAGATASPVVSAENAAVDAEEATREFHAWLDEEFAVELDFSPLSKTRLGDKSNFGDLDDVSEAALNRQLGWRRVVLAECRQHLTVMCSMKKAKYPGISGNSC